MCCSRPGPGDLPTRPGACPARSVVRRNILRWFAPGINSFQAISCRITSRKSISEETSRRLAVLQVLAMYPRMTWIAVVEHHTKRKLKDASRGVPPIKCESPNTSMTFSETGVQFPNAHGKPTTGRSPRIAVRHPEIGEQDDRFARCQQQFDPPHSATAAIFFAADPSPSFDVRLPGLQRSLSGIFHPASAWRFQLRDAGWKMISLRREMSWLVKSRGNRSPH